MSPTSEPSLDEATVISYRAGWTETVGLDEACSIVGIFLKGD